MYHLLKIPWHNTYFQVAQPIYLIKNHLTAKLYNMLSKFVSICSNVQICCLTLHILQYNKKHFTVMSPPCILGGRCGGRIFCGGSQHGHSATLSYPGQPFVHSFVNLTCGIFTNLKISLVEITWSLFCYYY